MERRAEENKRTRAMPANPNLSLLREAVGADDERAELSEEAVQKEEDAQIKTATRLAGEPSAAELALLEQMAEVAEELQYQT